MREMSRKSAVGKVWITMFFALLITAGMMLAGGMKAHASNPYVYVVAADGLTKSVRVTVK